MSVTDAPKQTFPLITEERGQDDRILGTVRKWLGNGWPGVINFRKSLSVGPKDPLTGNVGVVTANGAAAGLYAYDRAGTPGNYVVLYRDATNFYLQTAEGVVLAVNATTGAATFVGHIATTGTAPGIAANLGAGTLGTATVSIVGNDQRGVITVLTGTAPAGANATIAVITFHTPYATAPVVQPSPSSASAAALPAAGMAWIADVNTTTTSFQLQISTTALAAGTTYRWTYMVIG